MVKENASRENKWFIPKCKAIEFYNTEVLRNWR